MSNLSALKPIVSITLIAAALVTGCNTTPAAPTAVPVTPTNTAAPVTLTISGSGEVWPVLQQVQSAFEADTLGYHLNIESSFGTDAGANAAIQGVIDIGTMNRAPNTDQAAKGLKYTKFGVGGVAIFTNPGVGVKSLTLDQVRGIYSGTITNWSQAGGPDLPIIAYNRTGTGGSVGAMQTVVFQNIKFASSLQTAKTQEDMRNSVAATPGSIGFGAWPPILAAGTKVTAVQINNTLPDNPAYPILEDMGMGYLGSNQAKVQPLIDWLLSAKGQAAIAKYGIFSGS